MPAFLEFDEASGLCRKTFIDPRGTLRSLPREIAARKIFSGAPWMSPLITHDTASITMPLLDRERALRCVASGLSASARDELVIELLSILHDMWNTGYVHGDFHSGNIFLFGGQITLIDFEALRPFGDHRPAFGESYDLTGDPAGLAPTVTWGAGVVTRGGFYAAPAPASVGRVLGVPLGRALELFDRVSAPR